MSSTRYLSIKARAEFAIDSARQLCLQNMQFNERELTESLFNFPAKQVVRIDTSLCFNIHLITLCFCLFVFTCITELKRSMSEEKNSRLQDMLDLSLYGGIIFVSCKLPSRRPSCQTTVSLSAILSPSSPLPAPSLSNSLIRFLFHFYFFSRSLRAFF